MSRTVALLDACVLYPAPLRDLLMQLAKAGLYQARWSAGIHAEWTAAVLRNRPDLTRSQLDRTVRLMNEAVEDAQVFGHIDLARTLKLPDPNDTHVLAAAITGGTQLIVTFNVSDFPAAALEPHQITCCHPDAFLADLFEADPSRFVTAVGTILGRLRNPPVAMAEYVAILRQIGLTKLALALKGE